MFLRIENLRSKKLIGKHLPMSFGQDLTGMLWGSFMPHRMKIQNKLDNNLYSMQIFNSPPSFLEDVEFVKWAAVEVTDFEVIPEGMEAYELGGGLYAVFQHIGPASAFQKIVNYIFQEWLPNSGYALDDREHFELLGEKYKNNDPESEEEIWIPIKAKI
jgi:AraC family transcriptional regulator